MSGLSYLVEDRKADADTHLAIARSQNTKNGILGETKDESSRASGCSFYCKVSYRKLLVAGPIGVIRNSYFAYNTKKEWTRDGL